MAVRWLLLQQVWEEEPERVLLRLLLRLPRIWESLLSACYHSILFEGIKKIDQALDGVEEMSKHVDALLVINNERLRDVYSDLSVMNAFGKADDTLSVAAKSIAEIITIRGKINLDFNDVKTVLKDGGVAIMSTGYGYGEGRVTQAITDALHSPLLNNNDIFNF